jgi:hypothetical protein
MTKKTRFFLFGAVAFVVVGLSFGLVAYYGGLPGVAFANAAGPDELRYVPKSAVVVAYADVQSVMASQFRQRFREFEGGASEGQREIRDELGIDIERDIDRVVACMLPGKGSLEQSGVVIARGRFNQALVEGFVREHGGMAEEYKGRQVFTHPQNGNHMAVAFVRNDLIAMGSAESIKGVIDAEQSGESVIASGEVMGLVRKVEDGNVWAVGRFDAIASHARLPDQVAGQLPAITWFSASGHVNGGVSGSLSVEARDEEAAKNLRDVMGGFMALARLQAGSRREMQSLLQSIQLGGDQTTVSLSFTVPTEVFDMLQSMVSGPKKRDSDERR